MATQPDSESETDKLAQYYQYHNRLASYLQWPLNWEISQAKPSPESLARAGFLYFPEEPNLEDNVACPYCHLFLDLLNPNDDPMKLHKERSPMCRFVLEVEVRNGETIICAGSNLSHSKPWAGRTNPKNSHSKTEKNGPNTAKQHQSAINEKSSTESNPQSRAKKRE